MAVSDDSSGSDPRAAEQLPLTPTLPAPQTVTELSLAIKRAVEGGFGRVRVKGEVSGFKASSSGHLYFDLKDEDSAITACCWRPQAAKLGFKPEDGMEVIATGRITTYQKTSKYQIIIESMEPAGIGQLLAKVEALRVKLLGEGLFDASRKPPLPFLPETIGIITSPTGAVLQDIRHRIGERLPRSLILWPVLVQGDGAAAQIVAAIQGFNRMVPRPSVLIVARGGGSAIDLMAFNEEAVVRAAAASAIPLISAIGHETDTTLIDYAAAKRAPTPTAAAEFAVPERAELRRRLHHNHSRLSKAMEAVTDNYRLRLLAMTRGMARPQNLLDGTRRGLDDWSERLERAMVNRLKTHSHQLEILGNRMPSPQQQWLAARTRLDHLAAAGDRAMLVYRDKVVTAIRHQGEKVANLAARLEQANLAIRLRLRPQVTDRDGREILTAAAVTIGQAIALNFNDGTVQAEVIGK
ncbi:MAG: exodeoxyribonuclease VII large subunit [Candidatus Pacebacteria bacterium]|nr:exodeoxyribonuclease VII large subunit [Candidatus Paceibacterota bacterium]